MLSFRKRPTAELDSASSAALTPALDGLQSSMRLGEKVKYSTFD